MNRFLLILFIAFMVSCANQPNEIPTLDKTVVMHVRCEANRDNTYKYIKVGYSEEYPLIVVIDPHAESKRALLRISNAADFMPCLVVCSDIIENNYEDYKDALDEIIDDVSKNYTIDLNRIIMVGFSGGARMAKEYGTYRNVSGILMCGAGPSSRMPDIPFYGIIGSRDFNFMELYQRPVTEVIGDRSHMVDYYEGSHEWPDTAKLKDGFLFLAQYFSNQNRESSQLRAEQLYAMIESNGGGEIQRYKLLEKAYQLADDEDMKSDLMERIKALGEDKSFKVQVQSLENYLKLESNLKQQYMIRSMDADWEYWKGEINNFKEKSMLSSNTFEIDHSHRMLGFLGVLFYARLNILSYTEGKEDLVETLLKSFAMLEPNNPDMLYFKVVYHNKKEQMDSAGYYLDLARANGLKE